MPQMDKGFTTVGKNKFYLNSKTGVLKTGWFKVKKTKISGKRQWSYIKK